MDPATAIGVVSCILSFVTFASKIVKGGVEIYRQRSLTEHAELEDVMDKMHLFHANLQQTTSMQQNMLDEERNLCTLAEECRKISSELIRLLRSTKHSDSKGLRAKWKALAAWWNSIVSAKKKQNWRPD